MDALRAATLALLAALAAVGCGSQAIDAPPPEVLPDAADTMVAALPPSYVTAPIVFDLRPVLADLEHTVPRTIGSTEARDRIRVHASPDVWIAAELQRGPLRLEFADSTVSVSAVFTYSGRAWVQALFVKPSVSCGTGDVSPRMRVSLETTYGLTADWHIRTRSRVTSVAPATSTARDRCEVSFLGLDVTDRVAGAARGALEKALRSADAGIARLDVRTPIAGLWTTLQQPISIAEGRLWLLIRPHAVALGSITARDSTLTARLSLRASPRIVSGEKPAADTVALPVLGRAAATDSVLVLMEGRLRYAVANNILAGQFNHKWVRVGWRRLRIDRVEAMDGGGGRIILAVDLKGRARGRVYVVGTPTYDPATDLITVPDLRFDVNSASYLDRGLGWLLEGPLLGRIRDLVRIPASRLLDMAVDVANQEIDRELSAGVQLKGRIHSARTLDVRATRDGLVARALAVGNLRLEIAPRDMVPRVPDPLKRLRAQQSTKQEP